MSKLDFSSSFNCPGGFRCQLLLTKSNLSNNRAQARGDMSLLAQVIWIRP